MYWYEVFRDMAFLCRVFFVLVGIVFISYSKNINDLENFLIKEKGLFFVFLWIAFEFLHFYLKKNHEDEIVGKLNKIPREDEKLLTNQSMQLKPETISQPNGALQKVQSKQSIQQTEDTKSKYQTYLQSKEWQHIRKKALFRAKYRCQFCNSSQNLHVHHRTYKHIYSDSLDDLIVLCALCHGKFHEIEIKENINIKKVSRDKMKGPSINCYGGFSENRDKNDKCAKCSFKEECKAESASEKLS